MNWRLTRANSVSKDMAEAHNPPSEIPPEPQQEHRQQHESRVEHRSARSFRNWLAVISSLMLSGLSLAQGTLTRDDAIKQAENTPGVLAANARLAAAEAQIAAARLPISGNVTGGYTLAGSDPAPPSGTDQNSWNLNATLNFAGLRGEASDVRVNALLNLERTRRGLVAAHLRAQKTAVNLWHGLRRAESGLIVARKNLELNELQDRAAETRFKAGAISVADREMATNTLESARLDVLRAESRLESAKAQLTVNLGVEAQQTANEWKAIAVPPGEGNPEAREDVFEARAAVVTAELELDRLWRAILPSANLDGKLSGTAGTVSAGINTNLGINAGYSYTNPLGPGATGTNWSVTISASIPISPAQWGQIAPAQQNLEAARAALEATLRSARADVQARRAALPLSVRAFELAQKTLENARTNLDRARTRAASGVIAPIDVSRAEFEVVRAQDGVFNAQAELDSTALDILEALATPTH